MARGPAWTQWEDGVLEAARQVPVPYRMINVVLPHRSPRACIIRASLLREEAGIPKREEYNRFDDMEWERGQRRMAAAANDRFLAALRGRV